MASDRARVGSRLQGVLRWYMKHLLKAHTIAGAILGFAVGLMLVAGMPGLQPVIACGIVAGCTLGISAVGAGVAVLYMKVLYPNMGMEPKTGLAEVAQAGKGTAKNLRRTK